jgi:threonylcarbamoyladenosine tRNA methylthiotransferase CDKAL1
LFVNVSRKDASFDNESVYRCTVKNPSQSAMETLIHKGKDAGKPLVIAGCVPQGSKDLKDLEGVSVVGVQQIDRVVEVVEETLKGHEVRLLKRSSLPSLDLPKVHVMIPFIVFKSTLL